MQSVDPETIRDLRRQVAHDDQLASIRHSAATNGAATGTRLIEIRTIRGFSATILPDRGGDIFDLRFRGQSLGWTGPAGLAGLSRTSADQENGLGLLRGFSGALITCGFDYFGPARIGSAAHFGYALRDRQHYPLHGRASFLSADLRRADTAWSSDVPHIVIELDLRQSSLFGEAFLVRRRLRFEIGTALLELEDRVENRAHTPVPHQVLYHLNFGFPLIDTGTTIEGLPNDPAMPSIIGDITRPGFEAFRFVPRDQCDRTIRLSNTAGIELEVTPLDDSFSHIGQWWNAYPGMTCVGLEPASVAMPPGGDLPWEPERMLAPGETAIYRLRLSARETK